MSSEGEQLSAAEASPETADFNYVGPDLSLDTPVRSTWSKSLSYARASLYWVPIQMFYPRSHYSTTL